jgi:hypothetical protein
MGSLFTPTYTKAQDVLRNQKFAEPDWHKFLTETCGVDKLMSPAGYDSGYADGLDRLRKKIREEAKHTNAIAVFVLGGGPGEVILKAAQNKLSPGSWADRAAALKMLRHTYRARKTGGQDVWVYSPPKGHRKDVFAEIQGTEKSVKSKLEQETEIFSADELELMCDALQLARKISMDVVVKVGAKDAATKAMVKRWFLDDDCTATEEADAFSKLADGFKLIAAACNSTTLVFTDYLDWRKQRDDYFGGAIRGGEGGGFPVIYLEGAFTRLKGNSGKLWLCAETIIHELSHHEVSTEDHRYDSSGLKPSKTLSYSKTIANADSWGYFAIDLAGYLSTTDLNATWR